MGVGGWGSLREKISFPKDPPCGVGDGGTIFLGAGTANWPLSNASSNHLGKRPIC